MQQSESARPIYESPTGDIIIPDYRQRSKFNQKKYDEIKQSVEKYGQLQPGVCRIEDSNRVLVVGYTRFTICHQLGIPFRYELKEDLTDPYEIEEVELHENIMRDDLPWQDVVNARNRLHNLWQKTKGGPDGRDHSINKSAKGMHMPQSLLSEDIELAKWAEKVPEVANAPTKSEAKKIIKKIKTQVTRHEELQQAVAKAKNDLQESRSAAANGQPISVSTQEAQEEAQKRILLEMNKKVVLGDMLKEIPKLYEPESIDFVWFDPPWGVDFGANAKPAASKGEYKDDAEWVRENLPVWLSTLYQFMKPDSHLYLKFGITTYKETLDEIKEAGFKCSGVPIIWYKRGAHRTRSPQYSHGRSYEPIFFARKGTKALALGGREDTITTALTPHKLAGEHRSAAHPDLHIELLRRSCSPGANVLDPMAGSGAFGVACEYLKRQLILDYREIELSKPSRDLAFQNLLLGYDQLISDTPVEETETEEFGDESYIGVKCGSPRWMQIWTARPDLQEKMVAYSKQT